MLSSYDKLISISTAGFTEKKCWGRGWIIFEHKCMYECVYIYKFWIMLVLIQLEATALRVNYSYNSISASLDAGFFQKCSNGVSASCSTSCRRRGKVYASFGYFSSIDLTYYINRMKFILCYWVLPQVSPAERQMLSRKMRWEEKPQAIICLLQSALPFAAQKL